MSQLTREEFAALKETFRVQTVELLEAYGRHALELERAGQPGELLKALQRVVHTVKGDSMSLEFDELAKMAHRLEDLLEPLRNAGRPLGRQLVDLLLACGDAMSDLLAAYCAEPPRTPKEDASLCKRLDEAVGALASPAPEKPASRCYRLTITFAKDCQMRSVGTFLIRQRLEPLANILAEEPKSDSPEIEKSPTWVVTVDSTTEREALKKASQVPGVSSRVSVRVHRGASPAQRGEVGASAPELPTGTAVTGSDVPAAGSSSASDHLRVEVSKIDRIMNLVGELVIGRSMIAQLLQDLSRAEDEVVGRLSDANDFLERSLAELQAAVLKIRMVPVERVFRRFPRMVRDLAQANGKKVELEIRGGSTELDKGIIDVIGEPLLHLVRNAIDHGLETVEERRSSGKPVTGRLTIAAFYEGNHVHVVVEDDGRGIDVDRVARRATALGLASKEEIEALSPQEVLNFAFYPGFSTRDSVSTLSGRGIGLDVVRGTIEELKGTVEVATTPNRGTRFLIRLPLTLAILQALLVEAAGRAFAVPLTSVLEIVRLGADDAGSVLGKRVFRFRDRVIPLCYLRELLDLDDANDQRPSQGFVLVVGEAERRVGLFVEKMVGEHELVVKPIDDPLARNPGIAGASILGNGKVVLILNVHGLTERRQRQNSRVEILG